jgi:hypothetical protein
VEAAGVIMEPQELQLQQIPVVEVVEVASKDLVDLEVLELLLFNTEVTIREQPVA